MEPNKNAVIPSEENLTDEQIAQITAAEKSPNLPQTISLRNGDTREQIRIKIRQNLGF